MPDGERTPVFSSIPSAGPAPGAVEVRPGPRGVVYRMPRRRLGPLGRLAGAVALIAGAAALVPAGVALAIALGTARSGSSPAPAIGAGVFAIVCALGAAPVCAFALAAARGRTELEVNAESLRRRELAGPFRWSRTVPAREVRSIAMRSASAEVAGVRAVSGPLADVGGLVALCGPTDEKRPLAVGYPADLLIPVAHEIGERLGVPVSIERHARLRPDEDDAPRPGGDIGPGAAPATVPFTPADPPAGSRATIARREGEVTIELPAVGFRRGGKGMLGFVILWNAITLTITGGLIAGVISSGGPVVSAVFIGAILAVFLGIGVFLTVSVIRSGRRRAIVDVVGDTLLITQQTPFGDEQSTWTRDQIRSIRVGPSGTSINDVPILELQVRVRDHAGRTVKHGYFPERADEVLEWLAGELRAALGVPEQPGGPVPRAG